MAEGILTLSTIFSENTLTIQYQPFDLADPEICEVCNVTDFDVS